VAAALVVALVFVVVRWRGAEPSADAGPARANAPASSDEWVFDRADGPARTLVHDTAGKLLATFTDGSRTVEVAGPKRTFREPKCTKAAVTLEVWIRLAPQEWQAGAENAAWFKDWLTKAATDTSPDVLAIAFEYVDGAPDLYDDKGVRYAGDAQFGPVSDT